MLITILPENRREGEAKAITNNKDNSTTSAPISGTTTMEETGTITTGTKTTTTTEGMETTTRVVYNAMVTDTETLNLSRFRVPTSKDRTSALDTNAQVAKHSFKTTNPRGTLLQIRQAKVATAKEKLINWIQNQSINRRC